MGCSACSRPENLALLKKEVTGHDICQYPTRARLRDNGSGCSGPHLPRVLRPNRRPPALACPARQSDLHLELFKSRPMTSPARPWPPPIARFLNGMSWGVLDGPSTSLLYAPAWRRACRDRDALQSRRIHPHFPTRTPEPFCS